MRVAFTWYPPGEPEQTVWFDDMPLPRVGDTVFFYELFRVVTYVSLIPDSLEDITPADTTWHAEVSLR